MHVCLCEDRINLPFGTEAVVPSAASVLNEVEERISVEQVEILHSAALRSE